MRAEIPKGLRPLLCVYLWAQRTHTLRCSSENISRVQSRLWRSYNQKSHQKCFWLALSVLARTPYLREPLRQASERWFLSNTCSYTWLQLPEAPPWLLGGAEAARAMSASPSVAQVCQKIPWGHLNTVFTDDLHWFHRKSWQFRGCKGVTLEPCHSPPGTLLAKSLPCHTPGAGGLTPQHHGSRNWARCVCNSLREMVNVPERQTQMWD